MRQFALELSPPPEPSLENFVPGANAELLARLREFRSGVFPEVILYLWGSAGSGKSHLLRAAGREHTVDDVERMDEAAQIALFSIINEAREAGGRVLAAGNAPPARLPLREDLKSRLAWGLVYEVKPLTDEERASYLRGEAERRGMRVSAEVIDYLLTRARRDLPTLTAILGRLDRVSLEQKRQITLPLVRELLNFPE
jgi:DnaA family protein